MAQRITNPSLNSELVTAISSPPEMTDEEDIFALSGTQPPSSSSANVVEPPQQRLCKSRWAGTSCNIKACDRAHPNFCKEEGCKDKRKPDCPFWHTVRKGNSSRRATAPSTQKSGHKTEFKGKFQGKKQDLKIKLMSSQLEALRAKEKLAALTRPKTRPSRSYAAAAARACQPGQPLLPSATVNLAPTQMAIPALQSPSPSTPKATNEVLVGLLTALLSNLQTA